MEKFAIPPNVGFTRLCLDPWGKAFVRADASVCLCCNAPAIGSLKDGTLQEILDGQEAKQYRLGLITGILPPHCQTCPDRKIIRTEELIEVVQNFLNTGEMPVF